MNLLERVVTLLRANLNTVVERSEDPEKTLRQLQLDMRNQLVQVKTEVAKAIAESHVLQKRSEAKKAEADSWLKRAELAVQQGKDENARAALVQYNDLNKVVQRYLNQKKEQEQMVVTMRSVLQKLELKITDVDTTIELLETRKRNALIQQRVYDALNKANSKQGATSKAQESVMDVEARARALADIEQQDFEQQLDSLDTEQSIEKQLQHIKTRRQTGPLSDPQNPATAPKRILRSIRKQESLNIPRSQLVNEVSTDRDLNLDYLKKLLEGAHEKTE